MRLLHRGLRYGPDAQGLPRRGDHQPPRRFYIDPRDNRSEDEYYDVIGNDQGVFGCMGLLGCEDVCPKKIPLQDQLGIMRRMLALKSVKGILPKALYEKFKGCGSHCHS